ncbi:NAD-dependent epimerase/dehydratase family protein [Ferrimonas gelatinilytica]|uniref:NAD-dependent epimerase/dehydratase domain-containing protein n=1 Tax=Ferrimonas gelatinilytica TaxID=1255257 RepID=A0ABP9RSP7_9GAMM
MKNILITGSNGFLGSALVERLSGSDVNVLPVTRNTSYEEMDEMVKVADYCYHFAGEVNPKASYEKFYSANVELTAKLLGLLRSHPIPVVFSSTIHAGHTNSSYGNTKLEAENMIFEYGRSVSVPVHICKLPHLFGIGAKPDHNSILATWICNAIHGRELVVYDEQYTINYMCVEELVDYFIEQMHSEITLSLPSTYPITLGELRDTILDMSNNPFYKPSSLFGKKLHKVFLSINK